MRTPKPKGSKVKSSRRKASNGLKREVALVWDSSLPKEAPGAIWPLVLSSVHSCLSSDISPDLNLAIEKIVSEKDLKGLIELKTQFVSPAMHSDSAGYFASAIVLNLFSKTGQTIKGIDPLAKAVLRFDEAEKLCRITNRRLTHYRTYDHSGRPLPQRDGVHEVFHLARQKIENWLGPISGLNVNDGERHGPGGVVGLKRPSTTPYYKFAKQGYTCTQGAYWYAVKSIASNDTWIRSLAISEGLIGWEHDVRCVPYETRLRLADNSITIVDSNEVTFVDKDALTKRSISIEPEMNIFVQLAIGKHFKKCLRRVGCDLSDQSRNQQLAYVGSIQDDWSDPVTLDLRMASDTMSIEIVRELLPIDWFEVLDDLRSTHGTYREKSFRWEKFSSMGNGFTFELESMIFLALAQACSDVSGTTQWFSETFGPAYSYAYVSVYGDDIIVPQNVSAHLTRILRYAGFQLNSEKSFVSGPFRESCGSDFWGGVDVRPFYFKRGLTAVRDLIHLHNSLKVLDLKLDGRLKPAIEVIRLMLPTVVEKHLRGAEPTQDDGYIWCEPDEVMVSKLVTWHIHWQRWLTPICGVTPVVRRGRLEWRYAQFLYSTVDKEPRQTDQEDDPLEVHYVSGGSRGDIVQSGRGTPGLRLR